MAVAQDQGPGSEDLLARARDRRDEDKPAAVSPAQQLVQANIVKNVGMYFWPDPDGADQFVLNADLHPHSTPIATDRDLEVVSWDFVGVHAKSFRGVSATGRPVWFRGLTVVEGAESGRPRYHHFIDWREVLVQMGVAPEATRALLAREDGPRLERVRANPPHEQAR